MTARPRLRVTRWSAALLPLLAGAALAGEGCKSKPEISFALRVPGDVEANTTWYEIAAFAGSTCPPVEQLGGGLPSSSATARIAFAKNAPRMPALGDLPRQSYAFAAVARGADCAVLGAGCSVVDVGSENEIAITLHPFEAPQGACRGGTICEVGECVPSNDNGDPSVGAGCSLKLLGAGPLGDPLAVSGTLTSAPAIAATSTGFLVAYRELDPILGQGRLTLLPVDTAGGSHPAHQETLADRCSGSEETDAVGMAFQGDKGMAVLARAPCNGRAGFDFFSIDAAGNVLKSGVETSGNLASGQLRLSNAHAVAPVPGADAYFAAFTLDGQALLETTQDVHFVTTPAIPFGGATPHGGAWVTTTGELVALLASASGTLAPGVTDAGLDAGADAAKDASSPAEAGGPEPILRLYALPAGASLSTLPAPVEMPGSWGSLAAQGRRLFVVSEGDTPGQPVAYRAFDLGTSQPAVVDGFNVAGLGAVQYADVAFLRSRLFVAVEQASAISLVAFDHADTIPTFLREVDFVDSPRIPSLSNLRDGRLALAASDTRVAVAWITGRQLSSNDPVGGYAVFACTP